jgi:AAHS family benzoate transporter-like MFS transporter
MAGLGCGGLMPNAVALMNEYAPKRLRSTLVAIMFSGYSLGGVLCAGLGIWMLPASAGNRCSSLPPCRWCCCR